MKEMSGVAEALWTVVLRELRYASERGMKDTRLDSISCLDE